MLRRRTAEVITVTSMLAACANIDSPAPVASHEQAAVVCAAGPTLFGIDVSAWQGTIDWQAVAADGVEFAFIRVSHGLNYPDDYFQTNWAGARAAGIVRGVYQYFEPGEDPIAQAQYLLDQMGPLQPGDLPPVIDVESTSGGLPPATVAAKVGEWIDHVEAALGVTPIIYSGKYFWNDNVKSTAFSNYPLWIPQYGPTCPDLPDAWSDWAFFQTSDSGSVAGVAGPVDTNFFNGDRDDLLAFTVGKAECGDELCTGDEDAASCPADCPVCDLIPGAGGTVDESTPCFEAGGDPQSIRTEDAGFGGALHWTYTTDWDDQANYGRWRLELAERGMYRIEVYTDAAFAQATSADYVVRHAGVEDRFTVDQTATDGWVEVAEVQFEAGGDQWIHVGDNTGEPLSGKTRIVFDAIRLTRTDAPGDPNADADPMGDRQPIDPELEGGGCAASGGGSAGLALLLALVALRRRRGRAHTGHRHAS